MGHARSKYELVGSSELFLQRKVTATILLSFIEQRFGFDLLDFSLWLYFCYIIFGSVTK